MNQQTFKTTVFILKDKLFRFATSLLVSKDEAQDVVQEVMLKLWQNKDRLHLYNNIEAFAVKCIKNECLNRLKHFQITQNYKTNYTAKELYLNTTNNLEEIIVAMIHQLPEKQRMVMHLKDVEEYQISEISEILDMENNAVRANLMRARQKIRLQLEKIFEHEGKQLTWQK